MVVSDVSLGGGGLKNPDSVRHALDHGINLIDLAPDYGKAEETVGAVMAEPSRRAATFLTSSLCRPGGYPGHVGAGRPRAELVALVEGSLKRLATDHLDILFVHAVGERGGAADVKRVDDPELFGAFEVLKRDGKIRFAGASSHGGGLEHNIGWVIDSGRFDVVQISFNYLSGKSLKALVLRARAAGLGVITMKAHRAIDEDRAREVLGASGDELRLAAIRWAWANGADTVLPTMPEPARQLEYLRASGTTMSSLDEETLDRYASAVSSSTCRLSCGELCGGACPFGVSIADALRYDMYYTEHRQQRRAMEAYARLGEGRAGACATCTAAPCVRACPYELPLRSLLQDADSRLRWA
jgi:hypothetical protein